MTEEIKTDYFTTEELAKYLGLSVSTLNSWRARSNPKKILAFPIKNSGKLFVIKNQMCMNMREDKHAETTNNLEIIEMGKHALYALLVLLIDGRKITVLSQHKPTLKYLPLLPITLVKEQLCTK